MLGIVLWADQEARKAVIWCNDHGKLAFITADSHLDATAAIPSEGSLCGIETIERGEMRLCVSIKLICPDVLPLLAESLLEAAEENAA